MFSIHRFNTHHFLIQSIDQSQVSIMAEEGGIISTTRLAEDLLDYLPENPLIEPFKDAWIHMTENYSRFTIAVLLTYAIHQVSVSKVVFPLR